MPHPTASTSSQLTFTVSCAGETQSFTLSTGATLGDLSSALYATFRVAPTSQKLIAKGKKFSVTDAALPLSEVPSKLMLVGPKEEELDSMQQAEELRKRKHEAFQYHATHKHAPVRNTSTPTDASDEQYRFHRIVPYPSTVPAKEAREKMLDRLASDPAIRHVMVKHKFVVGTLTELHPHLQPTLLGLNKNAGEEICLRLLTDRLDGTRSYLEVRKVALHELAHNTWGPHDNNFKELNSLLNKEVVEYEAKHGIRVGQVADAWEPEGADDVERTTHTLNEVNLGSGKRQELRLAAEDELEERRERARRAAEARQRNEGGSH